MSLPGLEIRAEGGRFWLATESRGEPTPVLPLGVKDEAASRKWLSETVCDEAVQDWKCMARSLVSGG